MIFTGIGDEAGNRIETQIKATKELGWQYIEARNVEVEGFPKANLHDIPDAAFERVVELLEESGIKIIAFGTAVANWGKKIDEPFDLSEVERTIPRMQRLGTKFARIMSYAIRPEADQMDEERFRRMREIVKRFLDAGLIPVHENCMNYGGMSWQHALKLIENVPGMKWVFDTANPVFIDDYSKPEPRPKQDPLEFWKKVKEHTVHIHIKDARWNTAKDDADYLFPGEGDGKVREILTDAFAGGYDAAISIEPHMTAVFHDANSSASDSDLFENYVEYGRRLMKLVNEIKAGV